MRMIRYRRVSLHFSQGDTEIDIKNVIKLSRYRNTSVHVPLHS